VGATRQQGFSTILAIKRGDALTNRIGRYCGSASERVERASMMLGLCEALARLHLEARSVAAYQVAELLRMEDEAIDQYRAVKTPLPWEGDESPWFRMND
jgi:hypothetical protein